MTAVQEDLETRLRRYGLIDAAPTPPNAPPNNDTPAVGGDSAYALAALRRETRAVATAPEGTRNDTLNRAAFNLAGLVAAGALDAEHVDNELTAAAQQAGLPAREIRATLASGSRGSAAKVGARALPANDMARVTEVHGDELTADEKLDLHRIAVQRRAYELRVNDEARRLYAGQQAAELAGRAPRPQLLTEFLAVPDADATYRIQDLLPTGGRALLAAQYKAGKTTMMANLLRTLADGAKFLGRFDADPVHVSLIDTELDERMLRRWLRAQGITHTDDVRVVSLRGKVSTFNIIDPDVRAQWASELAGSDLIILDCLRPCLDATGLSEDKEAGRFLVAFDELCAESGAGEAVVVHHMGHTGERSRGDSRLLDWPDVLWKIVREHDDDGHVDENSDRYFSAMGRDVSLGESLLEYAGDTGSLTIRGGSRADKKARGIFADIVEILSDPANQNGLSRNELVAKLKALGNGRDSARNALRLAVDDGLLLTVPGPRNANLHILNPSRREA